MDTTLLLVFAFVAFLGAVGFMLKRNWFAGYFTVLALVSLAILSVYVALDQNSFSAGIPESYARVIFILAVAGLIYGFFTNREKLLKRLTAKTQGKSVRAN